MRSRSKAPQVKLLLRWIFRLVKRRRRLIAALLLCSAAAIAVNQLTPANQPVETALAASKDLPAGSTISASDMVLLKVPLAAIPQAALARPSQAIGQQLAGALRKGQILTDTSLLGQSLLTGTPAGSVAVPLRLSDAGTAKLVAPGQLVTVVLTNEDSTGRAENGTVLAASIPVLWSQTGAQTANGNSWLPGKEADGLVVVAASAEQSKTLAGASTRGKISLVLVSRS
ncbi:conserved hypothetical protein [Renibacterium salmoninarum ATCC 33209]|uniref:SAF domain-containing protein n=1 Tax=Renibacterium salmoninarum (strain ATCC 33209 / DSM 20767 / JCM 11484 / NBRC 15589 / NCIMB 2235) TaxID=288705 RepID=A9WMZ1_RENSM|nr:RcpC/CpaB family pilus assembly protein [Renibacterium salmoninarum]ABY23488.1 conserved hypothetical protein [Renibacterium salmoninarum ATCC 33209]